MTLKELMDKGLSEEHAKIALEAHKADLDGKYEPKERNQQLRDQLKEAKDLIAERDKQLDELSKSANASEQLKKDLEQIKEQNKQKDAEYAQKLADIQMKTALKLALNGAVHDVELASTLFDTSKIKLNESGQIASGFKEQFDKLKADKAYLFIEEGTQQKPKPGIKLFGNGVEQGQQAESQKPENPGVKFAKEAAARKKASTEGANKAAEAYFKK